MVKVIVNVDGAKTEPIEYELNPLIEIPAHVETLCSQLKINQEEQHRYGLRINRKPVNDLSTITSGTVLSLGIKPQYEAMNVLQKLVDQRDPVQLKTTFFYLRKNLAEDPDFAVAFVGQNGIHLVVSVMIEMTGNALAYCLQALEEAMKYQIGWDGIKDEVVQKILSLIGWDEDGTNKTNVVNCALRIGVLLASNQRYGFSVMHPAILKNAQVENKQPYSGIIACIGSTSDLNMQTNGLKLVNNLLKTAPTETDRKALFSIISGLGINKVLQRQIHLENQNWKSQIHDYQSNILEQYNKLRLDSYSKTNPHHESELMRLWRAVFPDQELKTRVSEQWKEMGFQGCDPATDFRGMGMLGLDNLIYIAENHPVIFRRIVKEQSSRDDNDYPVAVTGISITQLLFTIFKIGEEKKDDEEHVVYNILFDHDHAFEEMYCIVFQLLDRIWDELNAAYMDFPRVLNTVKGKVISVLQSSDTLSSFQRGCSKGTPAEAFQRSDEEESNKGPNIVLPKFQVSDTVVQLVTENVSESIRKLMEENKKQTMKNGSVFKELMKKGKHQNQGYIHMMCNAEENELRWERVLEPTSRAENFTNTISISDIAVVLTGQNNPAFAKLRKADEVILNNGFSLQLQDGTCFDFIAESRNVFVDWTDGIRLLMGQPMETVEHKTDFQILVSSEICVKLMSLEGLELPPQDEEIELPPLPPNFNFFMRDNKEIEAQGQGGW